MKWEIENKKQKCIWYFFALVSIGFVAVSLFWVIKFWNYMPYVDESANIAAVNNLLKEGVPRVGVSKESVMYDKTVEGHYYWVYLLELILRVPLQFVGNWGGWKNIQAVTNLLYIIAILSVIYCKLWQWASKNHEEKKKYIFVVSLILLAVMCSSGLMSLVHYVRYYCMAMMTFILSLVLIPVLITGTDRTNIMKVLLIGVSPSLFHLSYVPYCLVVIVVTLWTEKKKNRLNKKYIIVFSIIFVVIGITGGWYILSVGHNNLWEMLEINSDTIKTYIEYIVSWNWAEIIIAFVSIAVIAIFYHKLPFPVKGLLQIVSLNLLAYSVILGKKYNIPRYYYSLRVCYLVLVGIAVFVLSEILMEVENFRKIAYVLGVGIIVIWGVFNKGDLIDYPGLPLVSWSEYMWIEDELENFEYDEVIVFTDCQLPVSIRHPEWYVFSLRNYNSLGQVGEIGYNGSVYYYKMSNEFHATTFNQVYSGKKDDIERILDKFGNDDVVIVFWNSNAGASEETIKEFFENYAMEKSVIKIEDFKRMWNNYFSSMDL